MSTKTTKTHTDIRAKLIAESDFIKGHDVVIVEECFDNGPCDILRHGLLSECQLKGGTTSWASTSGEISFGINGGAVIFSKWPIKKAQQYIFRYACGVDRFANKGFAHAVIDFKSTNLHVFGTHMQSNDKWCGEHQAAQVRKVDLELWRAWIEAQHIPENELVIFGGDFNIERNSPEFHSLLEDFGIDEPEEYSGHPHTLDPKINSIAHYNGGDPEFLDYVFVDKKHRSSVRKHTQTTVNARAPDFILSGVAYNDYSDHFPVHVLFELEF
ncbi:hypothetical protein BGZ94_007501 [Podila epigama]|nr:hypothetical protein BGZ94_007501 [Podila epigama]